MGRVDPQVCLWQEEGGFQTRPYGVVLSEGGEHVGGEP